MTATLDPSSTADRLPPVGLSAHLYEAGSVTVLSLAGSLGVSSLAAIEAQIDQICCTACDNLVLEVSRLHAVDPTGTKLLVGLHSYMASRGGKLVVRGASGVVARALAGTPLTS